MSQTSLYFCNLKSSQLNFVNKEFEPVVLDSLSGLFAYILFKDIKLLVISNLKDYQSNHAGINLIRKAFRKRLIEESLHKSIGITLFPDEPDLGGEILLLKGEIIFWNFKSRSYSEKNAALHDESLQLQQQIQESGLLPECFISIRKSELFEKFYLKTYFAPNGQYQQNPSKVAQLLSLALGLSPLLSKQKLPSMPWEAGAEIKNSCSASTTSAANNAFSFFNRTSESQALLTIEPDSPKL
ncbi:hypothetical protein ACQUW5_03955 [Legionella sp. CNM-1927-20]|uniref:hypothetical protein n=1 Tax=Legionella sp. CNM-1927-20 TaxID=3422221 RepID=UPI00403AFC66